MEERRQSKGSESVDERFERVMTEGWWGDCGRIFFFLSRIYWRTEDCDCFQVLQICQWAISTLPYFTISVGE